MSIDTVMLIYLSAVVIIISFISGYMIGRWRTRRQAQYWLKQQWVYDRYLSRTKGK